MKATHRNKRIAVTIGIVMLTAGLNACDKGADSAAKSTEANPGYDAGYEFGVKLAILRQQQPETELDEAFKGLIDALAETSTQLSSAEMCAMLQVVESKPAEAEQPPQIQARSRGYKDDYAAINAMREDVVTLPSGVQYEVLKTGSGDQPQAGDAVLISYQASLTNGTVFDTTYDDGEPLRMSLDEIVVPGLKEALLLMNEGAKWQVVIPPSMGFGRSGNNMLRRRDLIYDIELISIETAQESAP